MWRWSLVTVWLLCLLQPGTASTDSCTSDCIGCKTCIDCFRWNPCFWFPDDEIQCRPDSTGGACDLHEKNCPSIPSTASYAVENTVLQELQTATGVQSFIQLLSLAGSLPRRTHKWGLSHCLPQTLSHCFTHHLTASRCDTRCLTLCLTLRNSVSHCLPQTLSLVRLTH